MSIRLRRLVRALPVSFLALAGPALAADGLNGHQLDVGVETEFPLTVGLATTWETPGRIRVKAGAGYVPGSYVDAINAGLTAADIYSDDVAEIIDTALQDSFAVYIRGGWRPLPKRGLTLLGGYQYLGLGGTTADLSLFDEGLEDRFLQAAKEVTGDMDLALHNHMVTGTVGYEWVIRERLVLGTSLGFAYSFANATTAEPTKSATNANQQELADAATASTEDYLEYVFEEWVHVPSVGLSVGYRFR